MYIHSVKFLKNTNIFVLYLVIVPVKRCTVHLSRISDLIIWLPAFTTYCLSQNLKVKGRDIYIPPLTGKPRPAAFYNAKWHTDRQ